MENHNKEKVVLAIGAILILVFAIFFSDKSWAHILELVLALVEMGILIRLLGKKGNSARVILVAMMTFAILSWILPAAYISSEYVEQGRVQMGLFDLFNYPLTALSYFGYIAFFLILVGGFYGVLYKIPAYRTFLDKIASRAKKREKVYLSLMVIIISLLVSICGMHIGVALFVPFIVSLILLMGYDKIVAALVTVGSICVGLIGSTYASSNLSVLTQTLSLKWDYQIGVRFVILFVGVVLVLFNTFMYIKRNVSNKKIEKKTIKKVEIEDEEEEIVAEKIVSEPVHKTAKKNNASKNSKSNSKKNTTTKSSKSRKSDNKAALKDEDIIVVKESLTESNDLVPNVVESNHSVWPFYLTFILLFLVFVLAFISWGDSGFKVNLFTDITKNVQDFKLFGFPIFSKVLGTVNAFGSWTITDMFLPMALMVCLLSLIYKVKFDDVFDGFVKGAKKALGPATIVVLLYSILVLVTYHPFQVVIYNAILGLTKGFNIATTAIVAIVASLFNSDIAYSFQSVVPYYASVVTSTDNYSLAAVIFQSMYGFTMLVGPTSLALMGILSYLNVSYKDWLKNVWKLAFELFIILLIIFIVLAVI